MSGYIVRNPLMTDNAQFGPPPPVVAGRPVLPNPLAMPAGDWRDTIAPQPTQADAADATKQAYTEWLARDRAEQVRLGYVDPATGALTPEGWRAQAQIVGGGFGPADVGAVGIGAIKTYHGSPHLFEPTPKNPLGEFRLDKIGTGEGNQAFGQGSYVAEAERVAREGYRDRLSKGPLDHLNDELTNFQPYDPKGPAPTVQNIQAMMAAHPDPHINAAAADPAVVRDISTMIQGHDLNSGTWDNAGVAAASRLDTHFKGKTGGHMYEVNLNAEPHEFLHWDKPLSKQSPKVQQILSDKFGLSVGKNIDPTGGAIYQHPKVVPGQYSDPVAAATALREAGIPGIRYLDRSSRGGDPNAPDATHNYAVWSPEIMDIIRRFGIAGLIGGGAAATAAGGNQGQNQ